MISVTQIPSIILQKRAWENKMVQPGCCQTAPEPEHPLCQRDDFFLCLENGAGRAELASWCIPVMVAPFPSCSACGRAALEDSSIPITLRRKAGKLRRRGILVSMGISWRSQFTKGVLLAPGPLCAWISAHVQPFLTLFDGLG